MFAFYCVAGPLLVLGTPSEWFFHMEGPLAVAAGMAGFLAGLVHLRQPDLRGQSGVAVGCGLGMVTGSALSLFGILALALLFGPGENGTLVQSLWITLLAALTLVVPTWGTLMGARVAGVKPGSPSGEHGGPPR